MKAKLHVRWDEEPDVEDITDWGMYHDMNCCTFCGLDHRPETPSSAPERCPVKPWGWS